MNLSFQTNMSRQTVQTQIRLLLEEQPDQGLHCLSLHLLILSLSKLLDMLNETWQVKIEVGQVARRTSSVLLLISYTEFHL